MIHSNTINHEYTRGGKVELSAEHPSISGVPAIITHCPPASINTYLHSSLKVIATRVDKPHHATETHNYIQHNIRDLRCVALLMVNSPVVTDQNVLSLIAVEFNPQYVASTATPIDVHNILQLFISWSKCISYLHPI